MEIKQTKRNKEQEKRKETKTAYPDKASFIKDALYIIAS
jgi:hypothetical protein